MKRFIAILLFAFPAIGYSQTVREDSAYIVSHFTKIERMIPMRDGVRLFTAIYIPTDLNGHFPFLMERTPYSCSPYGEKNISWWSLGPNRSLIRAGYIFVYQDVRGRYRSEGKFEEMTPARDSHKSSSDTDESSDTYDTIEWLLKNVRNNNGKVGIYGISYPGFYASASLPHAHPAIKAVSPQAPVTDEFKGDDAYHNGAFFLMDNFDFTNYFEGKRIDSGRNYKQLFNNNHSDAYQYFLNLGPIKNTNGPSLFNNQAKIWSEYLKHDRYDEYWQARNIRTHLKNIRPAVLVVGGWFDAEDMFGALRTYEAIEKQSPGNENRIVMGPWTHGAWSSRQWNHFGSIDFRANLNEYYKDIEARFFNHYLKDQGSFNQAEATVFETGSNQWKEYNTWPPKEAVAVNFYLGEQSTISDAPPSASESFDEYLSDPANPVPYTNGKFGSRNNEYLVEDQRFLSQRPDVLTYQTAALTQDLRVTGRIKADLYVSTTGTDADFIVKLIDILPADEPDSFFKPTASSLPKAGFQRMVRAEVFRGKFRNSYEKPEPFIPGKITQVAFDLNEIAHVFKKGHRIEIQVQSTWFPLVDRNPQQFIDIPTCEEKDFQKATLRIYHQKGNASSIILPVLK